MKFAIVSMVKNESDIIESFIRHNLQFADEIFVLDNGSDDNTLLILHKLQEEGLPIHLFEDTALGHQQQQISEKLLSLAKSQSDADIFMLLDADEFICLHPCSNTYGQEQVKDFFLDYLLKIKKHGVAALHWINFLPIEIGVSNDYINHFCEFSECTDPPIAHQKAIYSREMLEHAQTVTGNHHLIDRVTGNPLDQIILEDIALAHFPIRSKAQAITKILTNAISLNSRSLAEGESFHIFEIKNEIVSNNYQLDIKKCREIAYSYGVPPFYTKEIKLSNGKLNPFCIEHKYTNLNNLSVLRSLDTIANSFAKNTQVLKVKIDCLERQQEESDKINYSLREQIMSFEQQNQELQTTLSKILQQTEKYSEQADSLQKQIDYLVQHQTKIQDTEQELQAVQQQLKLTRQHIQSQEQYIQDLNLEINKLTEDRDAHAQNALTLHSHQGYLEEHLQESHYRLAKYKKLWVIRLIKPLIKIEQAISSANRYRKLFRTLINEKGSIGKAYQTCRRTYKTSGIRGVKALLRQQNLDLQMVEELSIETAKEGGFVILTTKHTHYIAKLFSHALEKVGISSSIIFEMPNSGYSDKWHIVICPQMFDSMPSHYLAFQMEQSVSSRWFSENYFNRLHNAAHIFDYSLTNIAFLQEHQLSFKQLHYMPIGILPSQAKPKDADFEYDVAFYGDPNCERRQLFLKKLEEKFKVKVISEVFGDELHALLKKARIVVNIHYYENALLETTRIYECLSLNKLVVSEKGSDQNDHTELNGIVDFIEIDDIDSMVQQISFWLNSPKDFEKRLQDIYHFQQQPDKFQFYLYRFLLSQDLIDFETFYRLSSKYVKPKGNFWCLSLPESVARRRDFDHDNHYGIYVFPGLRHNIGWIGCGLSYKFMMRVAEDFKLPNVTICEDDVLFNPEFEQRYEEIKSTLENTPIPWDIYSGLIADLSEETKISQSNIKGNKENFYSIDRLVSMVFNIYNQSAYSKIHTWDEHDRVFHNTIDRYIEQHGGMKGVITSPFLVGHKEELFSTLWGKQNTIYREMIDKSQNLLNQKINALEIKPNE